MMDNTEEVALNFGEEDEIDRRKKLRHPYAVLFHLLFRVAAILAYIFCGLFTSSFVFSVVVIIILLSMDFWTVKNISGRLLVGLRWWNSVDEDGKSHWVFESRKGADKSLVATHEARIFWLSLVVCQIVWIVLFFVTIMKFELSYFMVVSVGNLMNGANLYGYVRCKLGSKKQLSSIASNFLGQQVLRSMMSSTTESKERDLNAKT